MINNHAVFVELVALQGDPVSPYSVGYQRGLLYALSVSTHRTPAELLEQAVIASQEDK